MANYSKKKRIHMVLSGETPDRIPVSIWGHDYLREWSAKDLASQTIEKQKAFDYDFVKINSRWSWFSEIWGNRYEPPKEQTNQKLLHKVIEDIDDFSKIEPIPNSHPIFKEHLQALDIIINEIGKDVDVVCTLFSPLAVAGLLCDSLGEPLVTYAKRKPNIIHQAIEAITSSWKNHVVDILDHGASGLFYAPCTWTSTEICDPVFYEEFGRYYDLKVLDSAKNASFNILHVCGSNINIGRFLDYPVHVLNWDVFGSNNPSLAQIHLDSDKVVAGGIPYQHLHKMTLSQIYEITTKSIEGIKNRVMLTGGCAVNPLLDSERRRYIREVGESIRYD